MRKFFVSLVIAFILSTTASAEMRLAAEYQREDGLYVAIYQDDENWDDDYIVIQTDYEDDLAVSLKLTGHPLLSSELLEMLNFFGIGEDAFSGWTNRLDYERTLVVLGLSEGNW